MNKDVPTKRRRGRPRKNEVVVKVKEKKKVIINNSEEIILHLPIKFSDLNPDKENDSNKEEISNTSFSLNEITEDKNINNDLQNFNKLNLLKQENQKKDKIIKNLRDELKKCNHSSVNNNNNNSKITRMNVDFIVDKDGNQKIISKTDIACWWCTEQFDTPPCFIPIKYQNDNFHVFGCFCSFSCAAAYNMNMKDYKIWERHTLLKKLYNKICNNNEDIVLAPVKETLKKFGGNLDINEFRKNNNSIDKTYNFIVPPLTSIIPIIEETINYKFKENSNTNKIKMKYIETANKNKSKKDKKKSSYDLIESMGLKSKTIN